MRFVLVLLLALFSSCRGSDFAPDEFRVDYGMGEADSGFYNRNIDFSTDSSWISFGFSWDIGRPFSEEMFEHERERTEALYKLLMERERSPAPTTSTNALTQPTPASKTDENGEPKKDEKPEPVPVTLFGINGDALEYLAYAFGLLLLCIVGLIKKKFLVEMSGNVVTHVKRMKKPKAAHKPPHSDPPM